MKNGQLDYTNRECKPQNRDENWVTYGPLWKKKSTKKRNGTTSEKSEDSDHAQSTATTEEKACSQNECLQVMNISQWRNPSPPILVADKLTS